MNTNTNETMNKSIEGTAPTERLVITKTFPQKLMEVVDDPSTDNAIWWLPDGESFVIRPKEFNEILDTCFQGSKLFSFTRRLYRYGYRKIITSQECAADDLVFSHPCFQKGKPQLLQYVTGSNRQTYSSQAIESKGSSPAKSSSKNANTRPEKRQAVATFPPAKAPVQVMKPAFTANPMIVSVPRNVPIERLQAQQQQQQFISPANRPGLISAMMLRGAAGNPSNNMRAVLFAREQAHQQRLQQACLLLPQQVPHDLRLGPNLPGVNQSRLLDLLIRKRLSELQQGPSHLPFP